MTRGFSFIHVPRRTPLGACVASILALSAPAVATAANTWPVTSCDDAGPGTLRDVVAAVTTLSGDTVDMTGLSCPGSKISLTTGAIAVGSTMTPKNSLTINGPGASALTIDAFNLPCGYSCDSRAFSHFGSGTLTLRDLTVTGGHVRHHVVVGVGGCVYSSGNVYLDHTRVFACGVYSETKSASGGGVYAKGNLTLKYSSLSGNLVQSNDAGAQGGGGRAGGAFSAIYSTVDSNTAVGAPHGVTLLSYKYTRGGGISASGNVGLQRSTISNNQSNGSFGGVDAFDISPSGNTVTLRSSTISGNLAENFVGGVYTNAQTVKLYNSTIAFNTAGIGRFGTGPYNFFSPGLALSGQAVAMSVTLQSSLLSNNTYGGSLEFDLTTPFTDHPVTFNAAPANNLIRTYLATGLPGDTIHVHGISDACPRLGTLRDNGGLTKTHALLSGSPAIDLGNNAIDPPPPSITWAEDQRRTPGDVMPYPYPRESNGIADIGAYELNQDEIVFNNDFERCPVVL